MKISLRSLWLHADQLVIFAYIPMLMAGIGAYLVRLGQRAIQIEGQPIVYSSILTMLTIDPYWRRRDQ